MVNKFCYPIKLLDLENVFQIINFVSQTFRMFISRKQGNSLLLGFYPFAVFAILFYETPLIIDKNRLILSISYLARPPEECALVRFFAHCMQQKRKKPSQVYYWYGAIASSELLTITLYAGPGKLIRRGNTLYMETIAMRFPTIYFNLITEIRFSGEHQNRSPLFLSLNFATI